MALRDLFGRLLDTVVLGPVPHGGKGSRIAGTVLDPYDQQRGVGVASRGEPEDYLSTYGVVSMVYACVFEIANTVANIPLVAYQRSIRGGARTRLDESDPRVQAFYRPNPHVSRYSLWEGLMTTLELLGEGAFEVVWSERGRRVPEQLWSIGRPDYLTIVPDAETYIAGYKYQRTGEEVPLERDEVVFHRYQNPMSPMRGLSPLAAATDAVITDRYAVTYNENLLEQGARPGGLLSTDDMLSDDEFHRLRMQFKQKHAGPKNAFRTLLLEKGLKWTQVTMAPRDLEFLKGRAFNWKEILAVFGVPPAVVGIYESMAYANAVEQRKMFIGETIVPKLTRLAEDLTLFVQMFVDDRLVVEFDPYALPVMQEGKAVAREQSSKALQAGAITVNEYRADLEKPPIKGGDVRLIPSGVEQVEAGKPPQPAAPRAVREAAGHWKVLADEGAEDLREWKLVRWKQLMEEKLPWEERLRAAGGGYLAEQGRRVVSRLRAMGPEDSLFTGVAAEVLLPVEEIALLEEALRGGVAGVGGAAGRYWLEQLGVADVYDLDNPYVVAQLHRLQDQYRKFNDTGRGLLTAALTGVVTGGGLLGHAVRGARSFYDEAVWRADTLATTTTTGMWSASTLGAMVQARVPRTNWLTDHGPNVREAHSMAEAEFGPGTPGIEVGELFRVGGELMEAPGMGADPANNCNCHCFIIPNTEEVVT